MAFVHRERRKVGEVSPGTATRVGPGAYLALVRRSGGHGYAPFASTEKRTLNAGNVGLVNRTPGPGHVDTDKAFALLSRKEGKIGKFGGQERGLELGNENVETSPGPGQYVVGEAWIQKHAVPKKGLARVDAAHHTQKITHDTHDENSYDEYSDEEDIDTTAAHKAGGAFSAPSHVSRTQTPDAVSTEKKTTPAAKRNAFFTALAIDPDLLSTDPFDPVPLQATLHATYPTRGELLVEAIRRRHKLITQTSAAEKERRAAAAVERPDQRRLRRRRDSERLKRLTSVKDAWRRRDDAFSGAARDSVSINSKNTTDRMGFGNQMSERNAEENASPKNENKQDLAPFGVASKMGHQSNVDTTPGPMCFQPKSELFSEERTGGGGKNVSVVRPKSGVTRVLHPPLVRNTFSEGELKRAKPFLTAAERFSDDQTLPPGPGSYTVDNGVNVNDNAVSFSKGSERKINVDKEFTGPVVFQEGRYVRADRNGGGEHFLSSDRNSESSRENTDERDDIPSRYRYVRAGGGFAHGISDAAASARWAAAEAHAAAERRRTAFKPHVRAEQAFEGIAANTKRDAVAERQKRTVRAYTVKAAKERNESLGKDGVEGDSRQGLQGGVDATNGEAISASGTSNEDPNKNETPSISIEKWNAFNLSDNLSTGEAPGPGSYELRKDFGKDLVNTSSARSAFRSTSARFRSSKTTAPGPGYYDPVHPAHELNKKSFNATIDWYEFDE